MKKNNPPGAVALFAPCLTFLAFSFMICDRVCISFHNCIINRIVVPNPWIGTNYFAIKAWVEKPSVWKVFSILIGIAIFFVESGLVKVSLKNILEFEISFTVLEMYKPLMEAPHPCLNFRAFHKVICTAYFLSIFLSIVSLIILDSKCFITAVFSIICIIVVGLFYFRKYKLWDMACFKSVKNNSKDVSFE